MEASKAVTATTSSEVSSLFIAGEGLLASFRILSNTSSMTSEPTE